MKFSFFAGLILLFVLHSLPVAGQNSSYYIKVKSEESLSEVCAMLKESHPEAELSQPFSHISFDGLNRVIRIDLLSAGDIFAPLSLSLDKIEYTEPVPHSRIFYTPNDLRVELGSPNQWYHYKIRSKNAWDFAKGNVQTVIAVVDNAFLDDHPELSGKITLNDSEIPNDGIDNDGNGFIDDYAGWNARNNNGNLYIQSTNSGHGTHIAGLTAAQTDNGAGMASMGFDCYWLPVKAGSATDVITHGYEGITFAAARGAHVINCSWGSPDSSATGKSAVEFALSQGCIVVAAAGNFSNETPVYPATYQGVISVAATTQSDVKLNISSFGTRVNISAPGSGIWSTSRDITGAPAYEFLSGSSQASALVSGTAGLMKSLAPEGQNALIVDCLLNTTIPIDNISANSAYQGLLGTGRLDAGNAVKCLYDALGLSTEPHIIHPSILIFPNPTENEFTIESAEGIITDWKLLAADGRTVMQGTGTYGNLRNLSSGLYILVATDAQTGNSYPSRLVKK